MYLLSEKLCRLNKSFWHTIPFRYENECNLWVVHRILLSNWSFSFNITITRIVFDLPIYLTLIFAKRLLHIFITERLRSFESLIYLCICQAFERNTSFFSFTKKRGQFHCKVKTTAFDPYSPWIFKKILANIFFRYEIVLWLLQLVNKIDCGHFE